jgi:hypothetical protein
MTYAEAVAEFERLDLAYKDAEEWMMSGELAAELCRDYGTNPAQVQQEFAAHVEGLKLALENRNRALREAQDLLRQKVVLEPTKQRGEDGKATILDVGKFKVSSVTSRWFDAGSLIEGCRRHGLQERLFEVKMMNKDGVEEPIVKRTFDVNYEGVMLWLKANKLDDVIKSSYDEMEKTPMVKGPKPLAFIGEKKDK